jgi:hypothetical protein
MKRKNGLLIAVAVVSFAINGVTAVQIPSRSYPCIYTLLEDKKNQLLKINTVYTFLLACSYIKGQIYCYGGVLVNGVDTGIYSLDISQLVGKETNTMGIMWNKITPAASFDTEQRTGASSIALPDGKKFLIQGGRNSLNNKFTNQTIIYDTSTNTWDTGSPYSEIDRGIRQMYVFVFYLFIFRDSFLSPIILVFLQLQ